MELDDLLRRLAAQQHGVVAWSQARRWATPFQLRHRVATGHWVRPTRNVLRLHGSVRTFEQRCLEGVFDAGNDAVLSSETAAALLGIPGFPRHRVHVSRLRGSNGRVVKLAVVHRPRFLPAHHMTVVDGIPTTTAARTIIDLASFCRPLRVARALDNALNRKVVDLEELRRTTIEMMARGRKGTVLLRELLAAREAGYIPPASGLEADFYALVVAAGLTLPERQVDLGSETEWIGRVDYYWRGQRLVVEIDGEAWHEAHLDKVADARRDARLRAAGFEVVRVREEQLRERPHDVIPAVVDALARRPAA